MPVEQDPSQVPRDAKLTSLILQSMDVEDYEERVIPQLLDFSYRYVLDILSDAQLFAEHSERNDIQTGDVRMVIEGKLTNSFTYPPSRDVLIELADKKNAQPLPVVPEKFGVRLPPERHCLTGVNFEIIPQKIQSPKRKRTATFDQLDDTPSNFSVLLRPTITKPSADEDMDMTDVIGVGRLVTTERTSIDIKPVESTYEEKKKDEAFDF